MTVPVFRHLHRVAYAECTVGNHIYYARYLDILEAARGEFFRELGTTFVQWQEQDVIFPVIECRLRYRSPARYDDVLTTEIWITMAEGVRLNFAYQMLNQAGALILEAETFHISSGLNEKPKRLPEALLPTLQPHVRSGEKPG
jgi:acyl-CoA thioester hydrolase